MSIYIRATSAISPQKTFGDAPFLAGSGNAPLLADPGGLPSSAKSGDASFLAGSGDTPFLADPGGLPSSAKSGDASFLAGSGDTPFLAEPGDVPSSAKSGDASFLAGSGDTPFLAETGNVPSLAKTGDVPFSAEHGDAPSIAALVEYTSNRLKCVEPDYTAFIDPKLIRRMSRIIRMGVAAASACLQEAGIKNPDAIITGTAYGCLADTGVFLTKVIEQDEEMLPPTAFIQSTHNTVGGQIALMLQCHRYNNTFVHRGFSFESALLDAMLLLEEKDGDHVLVGGLDEITDSSHAILSRFGLFRRSPVSNLDLFSSDPALPSGPGGTIAGEGAAFFVLTNQPFPGVYARIDGLSTFYKPKDAEEIERHILTFLDGHSVESNDIDLVITGANGDHKNDQVYAQLGQTVFKNNTRVPYKHLCGEYPTSMSFALWLAANILRSGSLPPALRWAEENGRSSGNNEGNSHTAPGRGNPHGGAIKRILIYNQYQQIHHSLILVSAVEGDKVEGSK
jgi:3-oxoacyl-[acyl-carrier-protein] synthase II